MVSQFIFVVLLSFYFSLCLWITLSHFLSLSLPPPLMLSLRFVCKNNGVLFENQLLQIGIKSEYRQNLGEQSLPPSYSHYSSHLALALLLTRELPDLARCQYFVCCALTLVCVCVCVCVTGRMYLFYGNKTSVQFVSFVTTVTCPGELGSHILLSSQFSCQLFIGLKTMD